ncbi:MAG: hypothetical protein J0L78_10790 [Planctomycetes bacterium]|nr:hypothetical protein [Planctomycetota bacterium]
MLNNRVHRGLVCGLALLGAGMLTEQSSAQSYFYSGGIGKNVAGTSVFADPFQSSLPGQAGRFRYVFPPENVASEYSRASAGAGLGYLTASAFAQIIKNTIEDGQWDTRVEAAGFARVIFNDVVATGTPGSIPARVRVHLTGGQSAGTSLHVRAFSNVQVFFRINGQPAGGGVRTLNVNEGSLTMNETGVLTGYSGDAVLTSSIVTIPTNTPIEVEIQLTVGSSCTMNYFYSGNGSALTDFSGTLTLATDQPVFDLPAGYTINSAQARIVDNWFALPCPADLFHDQQVDDADFLIFVQAYNTLDCADAAMPPGCPADLNNDQFVDDADFQLFVPAYNALLCE